MASKVNAFLEKVSWGSSLSSLFASKQRRLGHPLGVYECEPKLKFSSLSSTLTKDLLVGEFALNHLHARGSTCASPSSCWSHQLVSLPSRPLRGTLCTLLRSMGTFPKWTLVERLSLHLWPRRSDWLLCFLHTRPNFRQKSPSRVKLAQTTHHLLQHDH